MFRSYANNEGLRSTTCANNWMAGLARSVSYWLTCNNLLLWWRRRRKMIGTKLHCAVEMFTWNRTRRSDKNLKFALSHQPVSPRAHFAVFGHVPDKLHLFRILKCEIKRHPRQIYSRYNYYRWKIRLDVLCWQMDLKWRLKGQQFIPESAWRLNSSASYMPNLLRRFVFLFYFIYIFFNNGNPV